MITFYEDFAGIGGFRLAFERLGWKSMGFCEIDKHARRTYVTNFDTKGEWVEHDVRRRRKGELPSFDVYSAGFPCQSFSLAGKRLGFEDTRGTLFFNVAKTLRDEKPKAFLLENVKGLVYHDKGKTMKVILNTIKELGYDVHHQILKSSDFGVPQARERIFFAGFIEKCNFEFPKPIGKVALFKDVKEDGNLDKFMMARTPSRVKMANRCHIIKDDGLTRTLTTKQDRYPNAGLIPYKDWYRFLSIRECARIQGFPDSFRFPVSTIQAYRELGNAVTVNVVEAIARKMEKWIWWIDYRRNNEAK